MDQSAQIAARHHAERPLPDDQLAATVAAWRNAARAGCETPEHREAVARLLPEEQAQIVRTVPDVGVEVTRQSIRLIY
jgi:hypothetical protein